MSDIYICPVCDSKCPMCDDEYQCFECEKLEKEKNNKEVKMFLQSFQYYALLFTELTGSKKWKDIFMMEKES